MERRGATPAEWFAAAGGLTLMAGLAVAGVGAIDRARSSASIDAIGAAAFGWGVIALYVVVVLDVIVAWALWRVFRVDRPRRRGARRSLPCRVCRGIRRGDRVPGRRPPDRGPV